MGFFVLPTAVAGGRCLKTWDPIPAHPGQTRGPGRRGPVEEKKRIRFRGTFPVKLLPLGPGAEGDPKGRLGLRNPVLR